MTRFLAALLLIATPAIAQEVVSPQDFRDYAEGWTLYFDHDGAPFGSEHFEKDGHTRWRYPDGTCVRGVWRPYEGQLCFLYDSEDQSAPLCWRMLRDDKGMLARLVDGDTPALELRVTHRDRERLLCGGAGRST